MVATRIDLQCPNGHPKTVLVNLDYLREVQVDLALGPTRCGVCGVEFEIPEETQAQVQALAYRTAPASVGNA